MADALGLFLLAFVGSMFLLDIVPERLKEARQREGSLGAVKVIGSLVFIGLALCAIGALLNFGTFGPIGKGWITDCIAAFQNWHPPASVGDE